MTEVSRNTIEADVTIKSTYNSKLNGANVIIKVPTPKNTGTQTLTLVTVGSELIVIYAATCKISIKGSGKAKYNADAGGIVWKYVLIGVGNA